MSKLHKRATIVSNSKEYDKRTPLMRFVALDAYFKYEHPYALFKYGYTQFNCGYQ